MKPEMTHPAHTPASTDPDRETTRDRPDSPPTRDRRATTAPSREPRYRSLDYAPRTFPTDGQEGRAARARAEPMTTWPLRDGRYLIGTEGGRYVVDADRAVCSCPDSAVRGARCKHVRRVALEIAAGFVPAPDERERPCAVCGGPAFVAVDAGTDDPALCARHDHDAGTVVVDRETNERLVVVGDADGRADATRTDEGRVVADYDTNAAYGRHEPVVPARYADAPGGRRYLFPASRLRPVDDDPTPTSARGDVVPSAQVG